MDLFINYNNFIHSFVIIIVKKLSWKLKYWKVCCEPFDNKCSNAVNLLYRSFPHKNDTFNAIIVCYAFSRLADLSSKPSERRVLGHS